MKLQFVILALTLVVIACTKKEETIEIAQDAPITVDPEAEKSAIQQVINNYGSALIDGSADDIINVFTNDAVVLPNNNNAIVGVSELREAFQTSNVLLDISLESQDIKVFGDHAVAWTENSGMMKDPETGEDVPLNRKSLILLKKETDGSWKFYRYMFNDNAQEQ